MYVLVQIVPPAVKRRRPGMLRVSLRTISCTPALLLMFLYQVLAYSQPQLPCGREAVPSYPDLSDAPTVTYWGRSSMGSDWKPPACTGWTAEGFSTLVTTVGRLRAPPGTEGLLRRIGAISQLPGVRYWSTTHSRWQTLIVDAHALTGSLGEHSRVDFSPDEIKAGAVSYYEQRDNLAGQAVYRMHIIEASENRIVFEVENVTTMRYVLVPLFRPGELQTIYFLDRDMQDVWRYYAVSRTGKGR